MDQADRLRSLLNGSGDGSRVIAMASGKGGVGKTNLCLNLAIALRLLGKRVIVMDLDIGLANADVVVGVRSERNLGHVLAGEVNVKDALTPAPGGIFLLTGSTGVASVSDLDEEERCFLVQSFRELENHTDIIIIDTGAGITRNVVHFASAADETIVVITPEPTAITDGYAMIKTVSREKGFGRIRLIVNQTTDGLEGGRVSERIRMVSRRFLDLEVEHLGHVVFDERVRLAVRHKRPFVLEYPESPASRCVWAIAERLLADLDQESSAFFERLGDMGLGKGDSSSEEFIDAMGGKNR